MNKKEGRRRDFSFFKELTCFTHQNAMDYAVERRFRQRRAEVTVLTE